MELATERNAAAQFAPKRHGFAGLARSTSLLQELDSERAIILHFLVVCAVVCAIVCNRARGLLILKNSACLSLRPPFSAAPNATAFC